MSASAPATLSRRFSLSLPLGQWRRLVDELQVMESDHGVYGAVPVEKQLERARAGEQLLIWMRCQLDDADQQSTTPPASATLTREVPLLRPSAKYLLTTCDRLRRHALREAWSLYNKAAGASDHVPGIRSLLDEARRWDGVMRDLLHHHGVQHPLNEMVQSLPLGEADLARLGLPCDQLLNGHDLLAL